MEFVFKVFNLMVEAKKWSGYYDPNSKWISKIFFQKHIGAQHNQLRIWDFSSCAEVFLDKAIRPIDDITETSQANSTY